MAIDSSTNHLGWGGPGAKYSHVPFLPDQVDGGLENELDYTPKLRWRRSSGKTYPSCSRMNIKRWVRPNSACEEKPNTTWESTPVTHLHELSLCSSEDCNYIRILEVVIYVWVFVAQIGLFTFSLPLLNAWTCEWTDSTGLLGWVLIIGIYWTSLFLSKIGLSMYIYVLSRIHNLIAPLILLFINFIIKLHVIHAWYVF